MTAQPDKCAICLKSLTPHVMTSFIPVEGQVLVVRLCGDGDCADSLVNAIHDLRAVTPLRGLAGGRQN